MTQSKHHHFFHRAPVFCSACLCLTYFVHSETGLWSLVQFPSIHLFCFIIYVYLPNGICHRPHQSWCLWSSSRFTSTNYMGLWSPLEKSPVDRTYSKSRSLGHSRSFCSCVSCCPSLRSSSLRLSLHLCPLFCCFVMAWYDKCVLSLLSHPLHTHHRYL